MFDVLFLGVCCGVCGWIGFLLGRRSLKKVEPYEITEAHVRGDILPSLRSKVLMADGQRLEVFKTIPRGFGTKDSEVVGPVVFLDRGTTRGGFR